MARLWLPCAPGKNGIKPDRNALSGAGNAVAVKTGSTSPASAMERFPIRWDRFRANDFLPKSRSEDEGHGQSIFEDKRR
jgi:hypothetical protein